MRLKNRTPAARVEGATSFAARAVRWRGAARAWKSNLSALNNPRSARSNLFQNFNHKLANCEFFLCGVGRSAHAVQGDFASLDVVGQRAQELRGLRFVHAKTVFPRLLGALDGIHHVLPPS